MEDEGSAPAAQQEQAQRESRVGTDLVDCTQLRTCGSLPYHYTTCSASVLPEPSAIFRSI